MKIKKVKIRNFKSIAGKWVEIPIYDGLTLISSQKNGVGKCVRKNTKITIKIDDKYKDLIINLSNSIVT